MTEMQIKQEAERNDEGRLIKTQSISRATGESNTVETDVTALFEAGKRTTTSVQNLVIEAELVESDHHTVENPWVPGSPETLVQARERIEDKGLRPAWEVKG